MGMYNPLDKDSLGNQGLMAPRIDPSSGVPAQQLDPQLIQQILALSQVEQQKNAVLRQRKLADQMRADARGQLQGTQAGRIYKAPGLANLATSIYGSYEQGQQEGAANAAEQRNAAAEQANLRALFEASRMRR